MRNLTVQDSKGYCCGCSDRYRVEKRDEVASVLDNRRNLTLLPCLGQVNSLQNQNLGSHAVDEEHRVREGLKKDREIKVVCLSVKSPG